MLRKFRTQVEQRDLLARLFEVGWWFHMKWMQGEQWYLFRRYLRRIYPSITGVPCWWKI